jgi:hypothetical protein
VYSIEWYIGDSLKEKNMKVLIALIFCSLLVACGNKNNSGKNPLVFSQSINSNEVFKSGYSKINGLVDYAYILMTIDSHSPIKDFYVTATADPNIDSKIKSYGTIILGRFNRGSLKQMGHLAIDLSSMQINQRLDEIDRISEKARGQYYFYIENSLEVFNPNIGEIEIVFILENDTRITRRIIQ